MTKNEILAKFYASREFNECINRMKPDYLREDLKSEVMIALCEEEEWFLQDLHSRDELKYWAARIILNMVKSNKSAFYTRYRIGHAEIPPHYEVGDDEDVSYQHDREKLEQHAMEMVDALHWYKAELIKMYLKLGSYRDVARETGIPFQSVQRAVTTGLQKVKQKLHARV